MATSDLVITTMNHHFPQYPHAAPGVVFINPIPTTPSCPPGFPPMYSPHGPVLPLGHSVTPLGHGPNTFDQAASYLGFSAAESCSLVQNIAPHPHMSQAEHRWLVFSSQPWVLSGGLEPTDPRGRSILHEWLVRDGPQLYVCTVPVQGHPCGTKHNRQDRALTHVRKHLNARPYECKGSCGNTMCQDTFAGSAYLRAHVTPVTKPCRYCGNGYLRQNVKRHEENCRMRR